MTCIMEYQLVFFIKKKIIYSVINYQQIWLISNSKIINSKTSPGAYRVSYSVWECNPAVGMWVGLVTVSFRTKEEHDTFFRGYIGFRITS